MNLANAAGFPHRDRAILQTEKGVPRRTGADPEVGRIVLAWELSA
jgi:hypothetical protein